MDYITGNGIALLYIPFFASFLLLGGLMLIAHPSSKSLGRKEYTVVWDDAGCSVIMMYYSSEYTYTEEIASLPSERTFSLMDNALETVGYCRIEPWYAIKEYHTTTVKRIES